MINLIFIFLYYTQYKMLNTLVLVFLFIIILIILGVYKYSSMDLWSDDESGVVKITDEYPGVGQQAGISTGVGQQAGISTAPQGQQAM